MPKISVVMPAYNAEKYIAQAIDSILGQSYRDFEFLILNDCSTDGTEAIISAYNDPRIVYLKNDKNMGVAATLNKGFAAARGEYIARMDADDISLPERFSLQVAFLDAHPEVTVLGTHVECFSTEGSGPLVQYMGSSAQLRIDLLFSSALAHPSVMLRRQPILALGGYDSHFEGMEDYELWCRVAEKSDLAVLPQVLLRYRIHPSQVTQQPSERKRQAARTLKMRQLTQLGIPTEGSIAETFYNYQPKQPKDLTQATLDIRFLEALLDANREKGLYDQKCLKKTAHLLAKSTGIHLTPRDQRKLCRRTRLLWYPELLLSHLKKQLRR